MGERQLVWRPVILEVSPIFDWIPFDLSRRTQIFHSWPQAVDTLLEDMDLKSMRSGGNWLTWPFKVIDLREIQFLKEERDARRAEYERNKRISSASQPSN